MAGNSLRAFGAALLLLCAQTSDAAVGINPPNLSGATAGSLPGSVSVSPSGASSFAIPFPVPPGTAGVAPTVGLSYSSQGGTGMLGHGWSLTGSSQITRCAKTKATDVTPRPVKLDAQDAFCLDGERLILKTGTTTEYRTEVDQFARITAVGGDADNGPASWKVESRNGQIFYYGSVTGTTFVAPGTTVRLTWALSRSQDRSGNYSSYEYANNGTTGEFYPNRIRYTGNDATGLVAYNAISFVYEVRPDPWMGYVAGSKLQRLKRLTTIQARINTAADGSGGTLKRQFKLAYVTSATSGRSLVQSVSDCDGAGTCLPATTFGWSTRDTADNTFQAPGSGDWGGPAVTFNGDTGKYGAKSQQLPTKVLTGDLDGDGKADLLYSGGSGVWRACLSTGTTFSCSNWAGGPATGSSEHGVMGDFNGDGKSDIAMPPAVNGTSVDWQFCLSTGSAFSCTTTQAKNYGGADREPQPFAARDMNMDGRDDLFYQGNFYTTTKPFLCLSTGTGFSPCTAYGAMDVYYPDAETQQLYYRVARNSGDLDGDGRIDEINYSKVIPQAQEGDYQTFLAGDTAFKRVINTTHSMTLGPIPVLGLSVVVDSNGDGYADIHAGDVDLSEVCYSKGTADVMDCVTNSQTDFNLGQVNSVADYDGDGRPDALSDHTVSQITPTGGRINAVAWTAALPCAGCVGTLRADFNGDGLPDQASYNETTQHWTVSLTGSGSHPDLLNKVTNGFGHDTVIEYKGLYDPSVYTRGAAVAYPKRNQTLGPPVVSRLRVEAVSGEVANEWIDTSYTYSGLRIDLHGRGSLGFEKVNATAETRAADGNPTSITTTTTYSQDFPTTGMPVSVVSKHSSGTVLSQTTNTLKSFGTITGAYYPYVRKSEVTRKDLDGSPLPIVTTLVGTSDTDTDGIDSYGNVTGLTETVVDGSDTFKTVTANTFSNNVTSWLIGRRTVAKIIKSAPGVTDVPRTLHTDFDAATGQPTDDYVEKGTPTLELRTQYVRDTLGYGVIVEKNQYWTDPQNPASSPRRIEKLDYDAKYRYPETVTNAKGHQETRTYDEATGQLKTLTGPNLLTTSWIYDGWGRKTREDRADGTATTWAYKTPVSNWGSSTPAASVTVTQQWADVNGVDEQTVVPTETFFDALGRQVLLRSWDYQSTSVLNKSIYDAYGRLSKASRPYLLGGDIGWTVYTRDDLGRPTKVETTDQAGTGYDATNIDYSGQSTTTTNAKSQKRTEVLNGLGKLKSVTDDSTKTTSYLYDPWGNLKRTTDPKGNQILVTYDTLGRKTQLDDPDLGVWNYKVNPLGQTYEQTDAKLQTTTFWFDELGRLKDRYETDQQSHWVYDTATKGVGKLAESYTGPSTAKDFQQIHSYDTLGRPSKVITRLDWDYSTIYGYDTYSRVGSLTHRRNTIGQTGGTSDQTYNLTYNNQGAIYQVKRDSTLLWTRNAQDALGRNLKETFASGLVTQRDYNPWTGRVRSIETGTVDANGLFTASYQDDAYTYDSLGNMLTRSQLVAQGGAVVKDTFTYDNLNRLKTTQVNTGTVETMVYDELGNITTKPNVGTYSYNASGATSVRPHAISGITGSVAGLTNPSFSYDANGNLKLGLNRGYQWSAANYPIKIDELTNGALTSATERTEFTYGPDRQRTNQIVRAMTGQTEGAIKRKVYYGGAIEKEVDIAQGKTFIRSYLPEGLGYTQETFNSVNPAVGALADSTATRYFHKDHLGSPTVITDYAGVEQQRMGYDAWGRRRNANGVNESWASLGTLANNQDNTGYTGQEQLDQIGLVHLNGRVYDPITGRMVSADPTVPEPEDLQAWNRYSYVLNSPLGYTDPTGFAANDPEPPTQQGVAEQAARQYCAGSADSRCTTGRLQAEGREQDQEDAKGVAAKAAKGEGPSKYDKFSTWGHVGLAGLGAVPFLGVIPDAVDFVWTAAEMPFGKSSGLDLTLAGGGLLATAAPGAGDGAAAGLKIGARLARAEDAAKGTSWGLSISETKAALSSAQEAYKGSTVVGHALSKHAGRNPETWGTMTGSMKTWNEQGMAQLRDVVRGPGQFTKQTYDNGLTFLEKRLPDGRGVRLNMDGSFKGFLD